jgi:TonB family protein
MRSTFSITILSVALVQCAANTPSDRPQAHPAPTTSGGVTPTWSGSTLTHDVPSIGFGDRTILGSAALVPFATYLNGMHSRIHPFFADQFIDSLNKRPASDPINDIKRFANVEIVVSRAGFVETIGILKSSGIPEFDQGAMDSVTRAQPFGSAPDAIVSPDGNVYMHWEFHRDERYACSTMNTRPILLKTAPNLTDAGVITL